MKHSFSHALKWAFIMNMGQRGISILVTYVLAAILGPVNFGVVAMASVFVMFLQEVVLEQGLTTAIVQRRDLQPEHLNAAFWLITGLSAILAIACMASSEWWASWNHLDTLGPVIRVLCLSIPIQGLSLVQQAILQREMKFKILALRTNLAALGSGALGVMMAMGGFGVWALVAQRLAEAVISVFVLWSAATWRPRLSFSYTHLKQLFGMSIAVLTGKIGLFLGNRIDALIIGAFMGPLSVGLYRLADRTVSAVQDSATRPLPLVALSQFSRVQETAEGLRKSVSQCLRISSVLTIPAMALLAANAPLLLALLGKDWSDASLALAALGALGVLRSFTLMTGPVLIARGKPYLDSTMIWLLAALSIAAFILAATLLKRAPPAMQVAGVAASRAAFVLLVYFPVNMLLLTKYSGVTLREMWGAARSPLLAGTAIVLSSWCLRYAVAIVEIPAWPAAFGVVLASGLCGMIALWTTDTWVRTSAFAVFLRLRSRSPTGIAPYGRGHPQA